MGVSRHGFSWYAVQPSRFVHPNLACTYPDGLTVAYGLRWHQASWQCWNSCVVRYSPLILTVTSIKLYCQVIYALSTRLPSFVLANAYMAKGKMVDTCPGVVLYYLRRRHWPSGNPEEDPGSLLWPLGVLVCHISSIPVFCQFL